VWVFAQFSFGSSGLVQNTIFDGFGRLQLLFFYGDLCVLCIANVKRFSLIFAEEIVVPPMSTGFV
jgi:hypothetical protein